MKGIAHSRTKKMKKMKTESFIQIFGYQLVKSIYLIAKGVLYGIGMIIAYKLFF